MSTNPNSDTSAQQWVTGGALYVVATPIGNLSDLSPRAAAVLAQVDRIAAEDTRNAARLLQAHAIETPCLSLHEHNESGRVTSLLAQLQVGESLALISDAGTPLISDPGYALVRAARDAGRPVIAVPGPCAAVAALSIAGIASDRFAFEGFLPAKAGARRSRLESLRGDPRSLIFYEAPHRIVETLADLASVLGGERRACIAREISKRFEQSVTLPLADATDWLCADADRQRGEFVVVVDGSRERAEAAEGVRVARMLLDEMGPSAAARLAARITGAPRKAIYAALNEAD